MKSSSRTSTAITLAWDKKKQRIFFNSVVLKLKSTCAPPQKNLCLNKNCGSLVS